jgi:hypothetical protein
MLGRQSGNGVSRGPVQLGIDSPKIVAVGREAIEERAGTTRLPDPTELPSFRAVTRGLRDGLLQVVELVSA